MVPEIKGIPDIIRQGIASGWNTTDGSTLERDLTIETDVVIIGTGAGGGTAAEILSRQGLKVTMIEEGPLKSSDDFSMQDHQAFTELYQDGLTRASLDGGFTIAQGRCVGGSTTINWTSSFRTPEDTLNFWAREFNVKGVSPEEMAPWFEKMEQRLNITYWDMPPNANNHVLEKGSQALGIDWQIIPRNVKGCWNLGYCGHGCPTNAKQSMLVTTIPTALNNDGELLFRTRAQKLLMNGDKVTGVECIALSANDVNPTGIRVTVNAKHTIVACGAIGGPGLLLRSGVPDPHKRIGKRTFLHPVPFSVAEFAEPINGFYGAPQSIYSDHFQWKDGVSGPIGFKLEVAPLQPGFMAAVIMGHGDLHRWQMEQLPYLNSMIALLRDGFHEDSQGGTIELRHDGSPAVDYPLNDYVMDGIVRALRVMAQIQFAAGAKRVRPVHSRSRFSDTLEDALKQIDSLTMETNSVRVGCAHVMGGCGMGEDPKTSVTNSNGEFHFLENLSVMDGSLFPTSIGANPQLSIYGLVAKLATNLGEKLNVATS
ncbi:MAG: GMC family oxidoreductase [Ketobacteraceae bacterium]|nr:GMC family oxidoreductase [Ketobacteraceae bacterium]